MKTRLLSLLVLIAVTVLGSSACATKKYVRNRLNERVTPLENRTGELEETSRRNTQDIARLGEDVRDVRGRVERAQAQADNALTRADDASNRAGAVERSVSDLRANLDKFAVQSTATLNFKNNSFELMPEGQMVLDQLAAQIKDRDNFILEIEGFADARGTDIYNNQLTQKRAEAARRYLAERHNISLFRMHIIGFGEARPVADNETSEGRAQNRRVEVRLLSRSLNGVAARQAAGSSQK